MKYLSLDTNLNFHDIENNWINIPLLTTYEYANATVIV